MKTKRILDVTSKVEARATPDGKMMIEGLIPYNSRSEDLGGFVEVISPTAFNKTLADGANVYAFWGHDECEILAATQSRTLTLSNSPEGLHFSIDLRPDCSDEFAAIQRGDVQGVSFGFVTMIDEWDTTETPAVRTLKECKLLEISPGVAFPAYPGAQSSAAVRSLHEENVTIPRREPASTDEPPKALDGRDHELEARQMDEIRIIEALIGLKGTTE